MRRRCPCARWYVRPILWSCGGHVDTRGGGVPWVSPSVVGEDGRQERGRARAVVPDAPAEHEGLADGAPGRRRESLVETLVAGLEQPAGDEVVEKLGVAVDERPGVEVDEGDAVAALAALLQ